MRVLRRSGPVNPLAGLVATRNLVCRYLERIEQASVSKMPKSLYGVNELLRGDETCRRATDALNDRVGGKIVAVALEPTLAEKAQLTVQGDGFGQFPFLRRGKEGPAFPLA